MMSLELELELFEGKEPFFTVHALVLPKDPQDVIRYMLVDDQGATGVDAVGFSARLARVKFPKAAKFQFYVIQGGRKRVVSVPLPEWPVSSGYMIRMARFMGKLII